MARGAPMHPRPLTDVESLEMRTNTQEGAREEVGDAGAPYTSPSARSKGTAAHDPPDGTWCAK